MGLIIKRKVKYVSVYPLSIWKILIEIIFSDLNRINSIVSIKDF